MGNANVTARLDTNTEEKLDLFAKSTARSKSFLIAEAVHAYVKEQAWQIDAIFLLTVYSLPVRVRTQTGLQPTYLSTYHVFY